MINEFRKQFKKLNLDQKVFQNIEEIIKGAGDEFPCLSCPSADDCATFSWFLKWFGSRSMNQ